MRSFTVLAAAGLMAAGGFALYELRAGAALPPAVTPAAPQQAPAPAPPPPPTVDARPQIRHAVEAAAPSLRTPRDVERYLGDLEQQARRNHQVTALEIEPAMAAIRAHYPPQQANDRIGELSEKMARLSAELDGRDR